MIKSKTVTLFFALVVVFVTSCHVENNSDLDDSIKELQTNQKNIQEKMIVLKEIQTNQVNLLKKNTNDRKIYFNFGHTNIYKNSKES